jgi:hypothetical protein
VVDVTTQGSPSPHSILAGLEADASLFEPEQLRERLDVLDALDVAFGHLDSDLFGSETNGSTHRRAQEIRTRLEAINAELYRSIRFEMMHGNRRRALLPWIQGEHEIPAPGPAYDYRDELLSDILQFREPSTADFRLAREMVFYQPTPVRHILRLITASPLSEADLLVDLGSGLGHVPLLASMLTGARSLGIEVEAAYVASAQECAQSLGQSHVRFLHDDARTADLSAGTVYYLYSPFTGSILAEVLDRLRQESTRRPIRICTFGPCTRTLAKQSWLKASALPDPDQIAVFQSRL